MSRLVTHYLGLNRKATIEKTMIGKFNIYKIMKRRGHLTVSPSKASSFNVLTNKNNLIKLYGLDSVKTITIKLANKKATKYLNFIGSSVKRYLRK